MIKSQLTVWERAVHSVYCVYLSWAFITFRVCPFFPFRIEGRMWDVIVLIPDHCLSIYFTNFEFSLKMRYFLNQLMDIH